MGYNFSCRSDVAGQVRAIAQDQIEAAIAETEADGDFNATVHAVRKRCKKMRGLLRLVRPAFDDFAKENKAFRGIANGLSGSRDAAVMLETYNGVCAHLGEDAQERWQAELGAVRAALEAMGHSAGAHADAQGMLADTREQLKAARGRCLGWIFSGSGADLVLPGLETTYRHFRKGMRKARKTGGVEAMHEWRKAAKYHWYHMRLLRPAARDVLGPRGDLLELLGETLGDHHNLAVLDARLKQMRGEHDKRFTRALRRRLHDAEGQLEARAFALGEQLAVDKPGALKTRFSQFWSLLPEDA